MKLTKPSFDLVQLNLIKMNIDLIKDRANNAVNHFDNGDYETVLAELYYLRGYLDRADEIIQYLGKKKISELTKVSK